MVEVPAVVTVQLAEVKAIVEEAAPIVTTFKVLAAVPILIVLALVPPVPILIVWAPVPLAILTVLAVLVPVAMFTVVAPVPVPRLRVRVSEDEARVMAAVWLVCPMMVKEEEALFTVRAPSEVKEV